MKGSASCRPKRNLNHVEIQQTVLWRVILNKFSLILSLLRKIYLEAFRSSHQTNEYEATHPQRMIPIPSWKWDGFPFWYISFLSWHLCLSFPMHALATATRAV